MTTARRSKGSGNSRSHRRRKAASSDKAGRRSNSPRRWSHRVMATSDALDLEPGVFKQRSAHQIALSLKRSAERSRRRKAEPFRSAMSMLTFYINRGGQNLSASRRRVLEQTKDELRRVFGRKARAAGR